MEQFIKLNSFDKVRKEPVGRYFNMRAIRSFDPTKNLVLLDGCARPMLVDQESMDSLVEAVTEKSDTYNALSSIQSSISLSMEQLERIANKKLSIF